MPYSRIGARVLSHHAVGIGSSAMTVTRKDFERQMHEVAEQRDFRQLCGDSQQQTHTPTSIQMPKIP